jgi:hypothetical protein
MAAQKLFIATPVYASVDVHFHRCITDIVRDFPKDSYRLASHAGECPVGRARNALTAEFLRSRDCTDILFIDGDLPFTPDDIRRIASHDVDLVGGLYAKKDQGADMPMWCINTLDGRPPEIQSRDGLCEVALVGTGFMRVRRSLFERMVGTYGADMVYTTDADNKTTEFDFWKMGVYEYPNGQRRWMSEDWYFCQMARSLGVKVWVDQSVIIKHIGRAVYPLPHQWANASKCGAIESNRLMAEAAHHSDTASLMLVKPEEARNRLLGQVAA